MRASAKEGESGWCVPILITKRLKGRANPFTPQNTGKAQELAVQKHLRGRRRHGVEKRDIVSVYMRSFPRLPSLGRWLKVYHGGRLTRKVLVPETLGMARGP